MTQLDVFMFTVQASMKILRSNNTSRPTMNHLECERAMFITSNHQGSKGKFVPRYELCGDDDSGMADNIVFISQITRKRLAGGAEMLADIAGHWQSLINNLLCVNI